MKDGLYRVTTRHFCAAFEVRDGKVKRDRCAPILRKNLKYWATQACRVSAVLWIFAGVSCTTSPKVERRADGSYIVDAGTTFMASRTGVLAEVKTREGDHIKYMARAEDSTRVPLGFLRAAATALAGFFWSEAAQSAEVTSQVAVKEATKLGTVQSNNATALGIEGLNQATAQKALEVVP